MAAGLRDQQDFPLLLDVAEGISAAGQGEARRVVGWELGLAVLGALCGLVSWQVGGEHVDVVAGIGTLAFLVAIGVAIAHINRNPEGRWYRGRAAAESVKTLTWLYAVGGNPFPVGDGDTDERLLNRLGELVDSLKELDQSGVGVDSPRPQITEAMRRTRALPVADRRRAYQQGRLDDQVAWYSQKARLHARHATRWMGIAITANVVGAVAGFLRTIDVVDVDLLGVAAAVAGAAVAWTNLLQHRTLANSYAVAVQDLTLIRDRADLVEDDAWPRFAGDAEDAISREHTLWLARRGVAAGAGNLRRAP
jgi:hypothetical protein